MALPRKRIGSSHTPLHRGQHSALSSPGHLRRQERVPHKALRLCQQVLHAISDGLAQSMDDVLQDLFVVSVIPSPSTSRLLVTVSSFDDEMPSSHHDILAALHAERSALRDEVASAIHRRRVPELIFRVVDEPPLAMTG